MSDNTIRNLDILADYKNQLTVISLDKADAINTVLTPEIRQQIEDIEAEYEGKTDIVHAKIAALTEEIKRDVLSEGITAKGQYVMAIWVKPRVSWDTKGLDGYALGGHPEVMAFQKISEPSVTIRDI